MQIVGIIIALATAVFWGFVEKKRGAGAVDGASVAAEGDLQEEVREYARPKLFWFNLILTLVVIVCLIFVKVPAYYVFMIGCAIALLVNFRGASLQNKIIKSLPIPKELQTQLLDNNNSYTYANMAVQTFSEYISTYLADMILNMLTYFISFNLVSIALHAVARALRIMTRLPILRGVNRMCGGALGFVKGICIVWLFFLVVAICSNTEIGSQLLSMIKESPILTFLYESNVFLRYILKL